MADTRTNARLEALDNALLAMAALRVPVAAAILTTLAWIFWLAFGLRLKPV